MKNLWRMIFLPAILFSFSAFGWNGGAVTVDVVNSPMNIKISAGAKTLAEITSIAFGATTYTMVQSVSETPDVLTISLSGTVALTVTKVQSGIRMYGKVSSATSVKIGMKDEGDHFFGISEQNLFTTNNPDLRGRTVTCAVMSADKAENFAQAWSPFYFSSLGYAGYFDTFAEGTYVFGVSAVTSITHTTNTIDWYVFYGPTGDKIHQAYYKIIGAPKKVPIWACGPVIWNDIYSGSSQVLGQASNAAANRIPLTLIWIDRPYSDGYNQWSEMNFNSSFANPNTWLKQTLNTENNIKVATWAAPCTFGDVTPPGEWPTGFYYLDLSDPAKVSWYQDRLRTRQYVYGVQGHKMDRSEEEFPINYAWYDGTPTQERRAKYIFLNAKVTDQSLRTTWGDDQFNFSRASYAGCQQYVSAIWGGDSRAPWTGLSGNMGNCVRAGFMGFPMWGSDCGGFDSRSQIPAEQLLRWVGFGVFSGFMESMLDGHEPWSYPADVIAKIKNQYDLRMQLLPYVYSLANTSADIGVMQRPLTYMYPDDQMTWSTWDEYLFGPAMLVAPIYSSTTSRNVYLPAGTWVNFWNYNDVRAGKQTISASSPAQEQLPVYIKENSIYPTGQIYSGNMIKWVSNFNATRTVVINAFPGATGESSDFTYVDYLDNNTRKTLLVQVLDNNIIQVQSPAMTVAGKVMVRLDAQPASVTLNGTPVTNWTYSSSTKKLEVPYAANQAIALEITAGTGPGPVETTYEAENLTRTASSAGSNVSTGDANNSNGAYVQFAAAPVTGDWLQFTLPNLSAATYNIKMYFKANTNRGICQGAVDGVNMGATCDEYRTAAAYQVMHDMGNVSLTSGNHTIRFSVTGKSAASAGYTMTVDKIVLTSSAVQNYTLTVNAANGSVTLNPAGGTYASGTVVTLTATPTTGYTFSSWSGDLSGTINPTTITMNANKSVTATFTAIPQYTLTTSATNGTIALNPDGGIYNAGAVVTLTATPAASYAFSGWSGDLTGTTNPATITMNANKSVTATFTAIPQYTLTTSATNGSVALNPAGGTYNSGTVVTLTATPAAGYTFSGWSGDLTSSANPATITMNASKTVTANFTTNPTTITFEAENLARTASAAGSQVVTGATGASNNSYVQFAGTPVVGAWLQFTLTNLAAATYNIKMYFKSNNNRCICQGSVDGANQGATCDEYQAAAAFQVMFNLGNKALGAGNHTIRFTVTGKNAASAGYTMTIDKIVLTTQ